MQYKADAPLNPGQVNSGGGSGGRGGGGRIAVGGGVGTILLLLLLSQCVGVDLTGMAGSGPEPAPPPQQQGPDSNDDCKTGADVETDRECRWVAYTNSIQQYWGQTLQGYQETSTNTFTGQIQTACGTATSDVGPFYCPADQMVYLDTGFFDTLTQQLGAEGGDAAEAYVIAHEYGHHISNQIGDMQSAQGQQDTGPDSMPVRLELEADCFAGNWLRFAADDPADAIETVTQDDLNRAVDAAEAVGDDRIQQQMQGQVRPESWTHGSAEMRKKWLSEGFNSGDPNVCRSVMDPATPTL